VHIYATHRTEAMSPAGGPHLVSQQCFEAAAREYIAASLAIALANKIMSISNAPVFVLPSPRRGAGFRKREFQSLYAAEHVDAPALGATFEDICRRVEARGLRVLRQPDDTLADPLFTQLRFCTRPPLLKSGRVRPAPDLRHMNAEFGALMLRMLAQALCPSQEQERVGESAAAGASSRAARG
jgi:hypothetical protein